MRISLDEFESITNEEIVESYIYDPIFQACYNISCTLRSMANTATPDDVRKIGLILDILKS